MATLGEAGADVGLVGEDGTVTGAFSESDYAHALTFQRGFRSSISA